MKNKETIWTSVQLRIDDVVLHVDTTNTLTQRTDVLKNNGYIEIDTGQIGEVALSWDNLDYFIHCDYKEFKRECEGDLRKKNLNTKNTFKTIKRLIKKAINLQLLSDD